MKSGTRLTLALTKKLDKLLETKTELFFAERPFLWKIGENYDIENIEERKKENEEAIEKTIEILEKILDSITPKKVIKQEELL